jgi:hypothetical protein
MWGGMSMRDDGTEVNPDLIAKPGLCVSCRKDDRLGQDVLCVLTRADQQGEETLERDAFEPRVGKTRTGG